jgi:hypothetical protein
MYRCGVYHEACSAVVAPDDLDDIDYSIWWTAAWCMCC